MARRKSVTRLVIDDICTRLEVRAHDHWPDHLWPAAHDVIEEIIGELQRDAGDYARVAWFRYSKQKSEATK